MARGPRVGSAAADWPVPESRLCREPHKESRAGARCRSLGAAEDEDREEQQTCPPWAGGAARRGALCRHAKSCTGCAVAELSGAAWYGEVSRVVHPCTSVCGGACRSHAAGVESPRQPRQAGDQHHLARGLPQAGCRACRSSAILCGRKRSRSRGLPRHLARVEVGDGYGTAAAAADSCHFELTWVLKKRPTPSECGKCGLGLGVPCSRLLSRGCCRALPLSHRVPDPWGTMHSCRFCGWGLFCRSGGGRGYGLLGAGPRAVVPECFLCP